MQPIGFRDVQFICAASIVVLFPCPPSYPGLAQGGEATLTEPYIPLAEDIPKVRRDGRPMCPSFCSMAHPSSMQPFATSDLHLTSTGHTWSVANASLERCMSQVTYSPGELPRPPKPAEPADPTGELTEEERAQIATNRRQRSRCVVLRPGAVPGTAVDVYVYVFSLGLPNTTQEQQVYSAIRGLPVLQDACTSTGCD
jgi:hypothetical protein